MSALLPRLFERLAGIRRERLAAVVVLVLVPFVTTAQGADQTHQVVLETAWAGPITGTTPVCTPEPGGRQIYGTHRPFNWAAQNTSPYLSTKFLYSGGGGRNALQATTGTLSNVPSIANMDVDKQAGGHPDFCVGFTLTPDAEPELYKTAGTNPVRAQRIQDTTPTTDWPDTHVVDTTPTSPTTPVGVQGDDLKSAMVTLPAGFAATVDSMPKCPLADFGADNYLPVPASTQCSSAVVGSAYARITTNLIGVFGQVIHAAMGGQATTPTPTAILGGGIIYNLPHTSDEFAKLGVAVTGVAGQAPAKFTVSVVAAPDGSGRLVGMVDNAPRGVYKYSATGGVTQIDVNPTSPGYGQPLPGEVPYQLYVEDVALRIFGSKSDHPAMSSDFAQNGTDCATTATAQVSLTTYNGVQSSIASQGYTLTGCNALAFDPSVAVTTPVPHGPGEPTGLTVNVDIPQATTGLETALLRTASVTLPAGLEVGAQVATRAGGLKLCSSAQFAKTSTDASTCPSGSVAGYVTVKSPLISDDLVGKAYLGEQSAVGELPALYLEIAPVGASPTGAARIKLVGSVSAAANGQITATFTDAPQLRFNSLQIRFPDGPDALFVTPRSCGTTTGTSSITSWASSTPKTPSSSLTISQGCSTPAFAPQVAMSADDQSAGSSSPTSVTLSRADASPWMKDISVSLPSGFLANLNKATECSKSDAAAGSCPDSSRMATVVTTAGAGSTPYSLTGKMFLVDRDAGAVAAASIQVRAKLGDLDLGDVIVPARIDLRPTDAGLTLTTTAPTRFHNLALLLRTVAVKVDRPEFPVSPTACGPLPVSAAFGSDLGDKSTSSSQITYTGCASLPFSPSLTATLTGDTVDGGHPSLNVKVTARPGDSNLKTTTVKLPDGVGTDGLNIKNACSPTQFESSTCPANTRVGSAKATVRITPDVITGDVYLVTVPGKALPGIGMNFTGRYAQRILSTVQSINDRIQATFNAIPDLPLTSLDLTLDGGVKSPLLFNGDICKAASAWETSFTGQGGQPKTASQPYTCTLAGGGSALAPSVRWSGRKGVALSQSAPTGKQLQSVKFSLPGGFKFASDSKSVKRYIKVTSTGGKVKVSVTRTSIAVVSTGTPAPTKVSISVKTKGIKLPTTKSYRHGLKKGTKLKVRVRSVLTDGTVKPSTLTIKVG